VNNGKILITGAGGLVGGNLAEHFLKNGWSVVGVDNDSRKKFFGQHASTGWRTRYLSETYNNFSNYPIDIAKRQDVFELFSGVQPQVVIHSAAQPSHDYAAQNVFADFESNAMGTLNVLEASRRYSPNANFIHFSTNKVYGDSVNEIPFIENELRFEYKDHRLGIGVDESQSIDQTKHSLFGVSKSFADLAAQEYGLNFGLSTTILRGGCLTGPHHSSSEAHGFLSYLVRSAIHKTPYKIFGFSGKQVRDNLHTDDIFSLINMIIESPNHGEVFNLGGGFENSTSILEAIFLLNEQFNLDLVHSYVENARFGDHRIYYTCNRKLYERYPKWNIRKSLIEIMDDLVVEWKSRI
jgi:CDP-paratose 2-epimerase